jgi:hypothetical protein
MNSTDPLQDHAAELMAAARAFHAAAGQAAADGAAPLALARTEEALQLLSASWYQLAADAVPGGLSHEQEAGLLSTFHGVAAALARCARTCRQARVVIGRRMNMDRMGVV